MICISQTYSIPFKSYLEGFKHIDQTMTIVCPYSSYGRLVGLNAKLFVWSLAPFTLS